MAHGSGPSSPSTGAPDVGIPALVHAPSVGGSVPGGGLNRCTAHIRPTTPGFAPERDRLMWAGLSTEIVQTIQAAGSGSTIACHKAKWLGFQCWCKERRLDPLTCAVREVLSFLQYLVENGLSHATVKMYAAGVSSCHEGFGDRPVFAHLPHEIFLAGV